MKQVLIGLIIIAISFIGGMYFGMKSQPEMTITRIVFDTIPNENPDTVFIIKTAEIEIIDTLIIDTSRIDTIKAPIFYHVANTDIEVGNWKNQIEYNTQTQEFSISHYEFQIIVPRIEQAASKVVSFGVQATYYGGEKPRFALSALLGFPRIVNNLYIKFGAISDESIGIGLCYIF